MWGLRLSQLVVLSSRAGLWTLSPQKQVLVEFRAVKAEIRFFWCETRGSRREFWRRHISSFRRPQRLILGRHVVPISSLGCRSNTIWTPFNGFWGSVLCIFQVFSRKKGCFCEHANLEPMVASPKTPHKYLCGWIITQKHVLLAEQQDFVIFGRYRSFPEAQKWLRGLKIVSDD